jgi:exodeoxyribonuclease III
MSNTSKIVSWNVNSIRARLESVLPWLEKNQPDVLAVQETKVENAQFPVEVFENLGYHVIFHGQKSYNGVAMISKQPLSDIMTILPNLSDSEEDTQARLLAGTFTQSDGKELRIINVYIPNGQDLTSDKYPYKLKWLERFKNFVASQMANYPNVILLGDFNIAPTDDDVYDAKVWKDCVLVSEPERQALKALLDLGFQDSFRLFEQPEKKYSWWHYRAMAFRRNMGLRIDLILISNPLLKHCTESDIDKTPRGWEKPSDHAPIWVLIQ